MREMKDSGVEWIGEIPKSKKVLRNKYMFYYEKGKLPSSTNLDKKGFAYIGASDLDSNTNEYAIYTEDETLPDAEYNDLLVLWDGARAGLCGTHKTGKVSSTIVRIRSNGTVYQPFLYWYYKGFENFMYQSVNGTTIPHMNRKYIENVGFIDWTIKEQQKIAAYLDDKCTKIDSIIDKQQTIIEKLKAYKQSVITEAVTKGLNPDVKMKDSGVEWIGEIPDGWKCVPIKAYTNILPGYAFSSEDFSTEKGIPMLRGVNITPKGVRWEETVYWNKEMSDNLKPFVLHKGDIVMGLDRPWVSDGTRITFIEQDDVLLVQRVCKISTNKNMDKRWIYHWLYSEAFKQSVSIETTGVSVPHISTKQIGNFIISYPPIEEQQQIADYLDKKCSAIDSAIDKKQAIIEKLTEYKKSLIYEVVTGKKEV